MWNVTLEVPGMAITIRRFAERHDPSFARTQMLGDPFDHAVLAGSVAALEKNKNSQIVLDQMPLQFGQLDL